MKTALNLLVISFLIMLTSCEELKKEKMDCNLLTQGLISYDTEKVKTEIHKLTQDLKPNVSKKDEFGHRTNILTLIDRINDQCDMVNASLGCYAGIETLPVRSEINISIDSSGTQIKRVIDILTPEDNILSVRDVH